MGDLLRLLAIAFPGLCAGCQTRNRSMLVFASTISGTQRQPVLRPVRLKTLEATDHELCQGKDLFTHGLRP